MDQAEDRAVDADAEGQRHHRDEGEARAPAHHAQGVARVLAELRGVLAGRDAHDVGQRPPPDAEHFGAAVRARLAFLLAKHLLHLAAVVGAEVEGQEAQQPAQRTLGAHARRGRRRRCFARAEARTDSMRSASARATARPASVSR